MLMEALAATGLPRVTYWNMLLSHRVSGELETYLGVTGDLVLSWLCLESLEGSSPSAQGRRWNGQMLLEGSGQPGF